MYIFSESEKKTRNADDISVTNVSDTFINIDVGIKFSETVRIIEKKIYSVFNTFHVFLI